MSGTYLCPYCYTEYKMWEVDFRCANKRCGEENDEKLAKYHGKQTELKLKAFRAKKGILGKMPTYAECPSCGDTTGTRLCPGCHNPLPEGIDEARDMIISIIGARDAGKSNYVGVLVHELKTRVCSRFGFSFSWIAESQEEYVERLGSLLYPKIYKKGGAVGGDDQAHTVERTESSDRGAETIFSPPIVCELARKRNKKLERYSFSFLDSAGEDFEDKDVMNTVMPYIAHSQGIIFLLDPMQISNVCNDIEESIVNNSKNTQDNVISYEDIVTNVAKLIRKDRKMKTNKQIDIPVVVTFSKFDALKGIVDKSSRLWKDSPHTAAGAFDLNDLEQVNDEIIGLLCTWGLGTFIDKVNGEFSNVKFLPCSAFGDPPKAGEIEPPKPLRIEDGILWIMEELGYIPYVN